MKKYYAYQAKFTPKVIIVVQFHVSRIGNAPGMYANNFKDLEWGAQTCKSDVIFQQWAAHYLFIEKEVIIDERRKRLI